MNAVQVAGSARTTTSTGIEWTARASCAPRFTRSKERTMTTAIDMKLEVVVIPVSDIDRTKRFYGNLGWRLDADFTAAGGFCVIPFTPPRSPWSLPLRT